VNLVMTRSLALVLIGALTLASTGQAAARG